MKNATPDKKTYRLSHREDTCASLTLDVEDGKLSAVYEADETDVWEHGYASATIDIPDGTEGTPEALVGVLFANKPFMEEAGERIGKVSDWYVPDGDEAICTARALVAEAIERLGQAGHVLVADGNGNLRVAKSGTEFRSGKGVHGWKSAEELPVVGTVDSVYPSGAVYRENI